MKIDLRKKWVGQTNVRIRRNEDSAVLAGSKGLTFKPTSLDIISQLEHTVSCNTVMLTFWTITRILYILFYRIVDYSTRKLFINGPK